MYLYSKLLNKGVVNTAHDINGNFSLLLECSFCSGLPVGLLIRLFAMSYGRKLNCIHTTYRVAPSSCCMGNCKLSNFILNIFMSATWAFYWRRSL